MTSAAAAARRMNGKMIDDFDVRQLVHMRKVSLIQCRFESIGRETREPAAEKRKEK
jgi:hypothetical protein